MRRLARADFNFVIAILVLAVGATATAAPNSIVPTPADQVWRLPAKPPEPAANPTTPERVALGQALFFDPRLSGSGTMSCASCHNPSLGWSDGLPTARGAQGKVLPRATLPLANVGYNHIQMWDGRARTLEEQALGPLENKGEMASDVVTVLGFLEGNEGYRQLFARAYPGEGVNRLTLAKAIAAYERTIVASNSPFDRWLQGDAGAMTPSQIRGFRLFTDPEKGGCAGCHRAPTFTDDGFHNIGLSSFGRPDADLGRYVHKPVPVLKGAFKTPALRDIARTAPYFHDGSAATLEAVVKHYVRGGDVRTHLSPNMKAARLSDLEVADVVTFLHALTSDDPPTVLPLLP